MTQPKLATLALGVLLALGLFCSIPMVVADDSDYSSNDASKAVDPDLKRARELLGNDNYPKALTHLKKVLQRDPNNPDVHNLLGYSYRKLDRVDEAFTHYNEALRIKPGHLGANEYIGELYLELGQPEKAAAHLKVLDEECLFGCDEYDDLKQALEDYKRRNP